MYVLNAKLALPASSYFTIAVPTVNWPVTAWFKGYFGILATLSAYCRKHLASGSIAAVFVML
jgi:hypothetical protein